jgi:hypothetical protein
MAFTVTTTGVDDVSTYLGNVSRELSKGVLDELGARAFVGLRQGAGVHSPRPNGTGKLFASLYNRAPNQLTREVGHDSTAAPYAQWVIHGSKPHVIRPRFAKALSFVWHGHRVFFQKVNHPGYIGDNYLQRTEDSVLAQLGNIVDSTLKRL